MVFSRLMPGRSCCEPLIYSFDECEDTTYASKIWHRDKNFEALTACCAHDQPPKTSSDSTTWRRYRLRAGDCLRRLSRGGFAGEDLSLISAPRRSDGIARINEASTASLTATSPVPGTLKQLLRPFVLLELPGELRNQIWEQYFEGAVVYVVRSQESEESGWRFQICHFGSMDAALDVSSVYVRPSAGVHTEPLASFTTPERMIARLGLGGRPDREGICKVFGLSKQVRAEAHYVFASNCQHVFSSLTCFAAFVKADTGLGSIQVRWIRDLEIFTDFSSSNSEISKDVVKLLAQCVSLRKASINIFNRSTTFYNLLRLDIFRKTPAVAFQMDCHHRNYLMSNPVVLCKLTPEHRQAEQLRIVQWVRQQGPVAWRTNLREANKSTYCIGTLEMSRGGYRTTIDATIAGLDNIMPVSKPEVAEGSHYPCREKSATEAKHSREA